MDELLNSLKNYIKYNPITSLLIFIAVSIAIISSGYTKEIGIIGGSFLFVITIARFNQTQKQISLTEDNNLNTTFKDTVTLLGNENTSVRMGGVYTLIDIAKANPDKYAKRINDILCNYIVEETNKEPYNTRHIKELVDLVIIENSELFENFTKNLSKSIFKDIFFQSPFKKNIQNIIFVESSFNNSPFSNLILDKVDFYHCTFDLLSMNNTDLKTITFEGCSFDKLSLSKSTLDDCTFFCLPVNEFVAFSNSTLNNCTFNYSAMGDGAKSIYFTFTKTNLKDTNIAIIPKNHYTLEFEECTLENATIPCDGCNETIKYEFIISKTYSNKNIGDIL